MIDILLFAVVRVMFEEPQYIFREESGLATVCLVKDLETATSFEVNSTTVQNTALGAILAIMNDDTMLQECSLHKHAVHIRVL